MRKIKLEAHDKLILLQVNRKRKGTLDFNDKRMRFFPSFKGISHNL